MARIRNGLTQFGRALSVLRRRQRGPAGHVIFAAFTDGKFHGNGKLEPRTFLPPFQTELAAAGVSTELVSDPQALSKAVGPDSVTIHIYKEVAGAPTVPTDSPIVFNAPVLGTLIANKKDTNLTLSRAGIAVPKMIASGDGETPVFSNDLASTGAQVALKYRPDHYNTEFIDTRVPFEGEDFYTTVRLLCVGGTLVHCNVGARAVSSQSPAVHGRDTPRNPALITHLHQVLVQDRLEELKALAAHLGNTLGPGFFGHDLVIDRTTSVPHVCETGFKFDGRAYVAHLDPIMDKLPMHQPYINGTFQKAAARAFLKECQSRGALLAR